MFETGIWLRWRIFAPDWRRGCHKLSDRCRHRLDGPHPGRWQPQQFQRNVVYVGWTACDGAREPCETRPVLWRGTRRWRICGSRQQGFPRVHLPLCCRNIRPGWATHYLSGDQLHAAWFSQLVDAHKLLVEKETDMSQLRNTFTNLQLLLLNFLIVRLCYFCYILSTFEFIGCWKCV